ncbi:MAG: hypothetical protein ACHQ52_14375 [Candidatus Eisenbacteria bacterium]
MRRWTIVMLVLTTMYGCGHEAKTTKELTERQRDSIIATEKALPGSDVVGRALATSDSAAARAQRMDQQVSQTSEGSDEGK